MVDAGDNVNAFDLAQKTQTLLRPLIPEGRAVDVVNDEEEVGEICSGKMCPNVFITLIRVNYLFHSFV